MPDKSPDEIDEGHSPAEIEAARKLFAGPCDFVSGAASIACLAGAMSGSRVSRSCKLKSHRTTHTSLSQNA